MCVWGCVCVFCVGVCIGGGCVCGVGGGVCVCLPQTFFLSLTIHSEKLLPQTR